MTTRAITESGMTFAPYPAGQCFYIEKSQCYLRLQEGVQMAEFLLLRQYEGEPPAVWVVEAKSSCPRELGSYIEEIRAKLTNGFMLGVAVCLDRHSEAEKELPQGFKELDLKIATFRFVLIVNGVPEYHLEVLKSALAQAMKPLVKTWALPALSVAVLNDDIARKHGLILPAAGAAA
jgi:hypothetical protein